jgi:hypothetical protein
MPRLATLLLLVAVAACGGKSSTSSTSNTTPEGGGGGAKLPWEAALTVGAEFTLVDGMTAGMPEEDAGDPVVVKVTNVEATGDQRVYTLDWGEGGNGPSKIIVNGAQVLVGDAKPEDMQPPWETPVGNCYAEDFSNPDGCEDICDAALCLDASGIVSVSGLYAPGYGEYILKK